MHSILSSRFACIFFYLSIKGRLFVLPLSLGKDLPFFIFLFPPFSEK